MHCPVCRTKMQERKGMYGPFYYCKPHGTISVQGTKVHATGEIVGFLSRLQRSTRSTIMPYSGMSRTVDLDFEIRKQAMLFGVEITELDRFIEGNEVTADREQDHWMNFRPY